jgi:hypothetical protein
MIRLRCLTAREGRRRRREEHDADSAQRAGRVIGGGQAVGQGVPGVQGEGVAPREFLSRQSAVGGRWGSRAPGVEARQAQLDAPGRAGGGSSGERHGAGTTGVGTVAGGPRVSQRRAAELGSGGAVGVGTSPAGNPHQAAAGVSRPRGPGASDADRSATGRVSAGEGGARRPWGG